MQSGPSKSSPGHMVYPRRVREKRKCVHKTSYTSAYINKFAGPCAQGVLDPVMIPCPMSLSCAVLFCSIGSFSIRTSPRGIGSQKYAPCWLPLSVATFFTLKKRRVLPFDLHMGRARTDQGRQHTHHIPQLIVSWSNLSPQALFCYNFDRISIEFR